MASRCASRAPCDLKEYAPRIQARMIPDSALYFAKELGTKEQHANPLIQQPLRPRGSARPRSNWARWSKPRSRDRSECLCDPERCGYSF